MAGTGRLPSHILLKVALELDREAVSEHFEEGWTEKDLLHLVENCIRERLKPRLHRHAGPSVEGEEYLQGVQDVYDAELDYAETLGL